MGQRGSVQCICLRYFCCISVPPTPPPPARPARTRTCESKCGLAFTLCKIRQGVFVSRGLR